LKRSLAASQQASARLRGEVVYIDHFGNAITNLRNEWLDLPEASISFRGKTLCPLGRFTSRSPRAGGCRARLERLSGNRAQWWQRSAKAGLQVGSAITFRLAEADAPNDGVIGSKRATA